MSERIERFLNDIEQNARRIKEEATGFAESDFRNRAINILANVILLREELDVDHPPAPKGHWSDECTCPFFHDGSCENPTNVRH